MRVYIEADTALFTYLYVHSGKTVGTEYVEDDVLGILIMGL